MSYKIVIDNSLLAERLNVLDTRLFALLIRAVYKAATRQNALDGRKIYWGGRIQQHVLLECCCSSLFLVTSGVRQQQISYFEVQIRTKAVMEGQGHAQPEKANNL